MARRATVGESYGTALLNITAKNQRRYGGYIIHLGVVFIFLGITMSSVYRVEELHTVKPGESFDVGRYTLTYQGVHDLSDAHMARLIATVQVADRGQHIATLEPEKRFYKKPEQPATQVAFRSTLRDDLYVVLGAAEDDGTATFQAYINPLVAWLWIGGLVLVAGTGIAIVPIPAVRARERARAQSLARRESA
jgi:cytochrome c-type biogenesis protein CcmF